MAFVQKQLTPLTADEVRASVRKAFTAINSIAPNTNQVALMVAQSALETGHWRKCYNYNIGNIRAGKSWGGNRTSFPSSEVVDGVNRQYAEGVGNEFRAYATLDAAVIDYVSELFANADWKRGLLSGRPDEFVKMLTKNPGQRYFTAAPEVYLATLRQVFVKYGGSAMAAAPAAGLGLETTPTAPTVSRLESALAVNMPSLSTGMRGPAVACLQRVLRSRTLWWQGKIDGDFGPLTESAVRRVQQEANIPISGIVNDVTWEALLS